MLGSTCLELFSSLSLYGEFASPGEVGADYEEDFCQKHGSECAPRSSDKSATVRPGIDAQVVPLVSRKSEEINWLLDSRKCFSFPRSVTSGISQLLV